MAKKTSAAKTREPKLPDSELEVMRVLWRMNHATARDVWQELYDSGSRWTYATVNTLLQRLEGKGLANCDKSNVSYVYSPKISRTQVIKKRVKDLVDKLYEGKGAPLVVHLLKSQKLSKDEIAEINSALGDSTRTNG